MAEEGSSHEVCLCENQSWALLNSDADNSSGNNPSSISDKINKIPASNPVSTPTRTESKDPPPPQPLRTSSKKRGRDGSEVHKSNAMKGGSNEAAGEHEIHILTERERRKKMRDMFANLHALLPQLPKKADKSSIVDEAVNYIRTLQSTLQRLQKQKIERLQSTTSFTIDPSTYLINSPPLHTLIPYNTREAFLADQGSSNDNGSLICSGKSSLNSSPQASPIRLPVVFQIWTSSNVVLTVCGDEAQFTICSAQKLGTLSAILFVLEKYKIEVLAANISSDSNRSVYMILAQARGVQDQLMEFFQVEYIYRQAAVEIMHWASA